MDVEMQYPIGVQSFSEIREEGLLYVDKTDLVYRLVKGTKYNFLSRPRRFGKSLLVSTLEAYFQGRRELFAGIGRSTPCCTWILAGIISLFPAC